MKKFFRIFGTAALAAMTIACAKEIENRIQPVEQQGDAFRLEARVSESDFNAAPASRTSVSDSWKVSWNPGDKMSVIVNNGTTATANEFTNATGGTSFTTTSSNFPLAAGTYNYHVFYPYTAEFTGLNADGTLTGLIRIPQGTATQSASGDKSHLANLPLYGYVEGLNEIDVPQVAMHHLTAVVQVNFQNLSSAPVVVSKVELSCSNAKVVMGGKYSVNCKTGALTASAVASDMSKKATLNVSNVSVAANETGVFYIPVAPFNVGTGNTFNITLTTDKGAITISKTKISIRFLAGKVKATTAIYAAAPGNVVDNETQVVDMPPITVGSTKFTLMDRNLGATSNDPATAEAKGDLYQWGRGADGHQKVYAGAGTNILEQPILSSVVSAQGLTYDTYKNSSDYSGLFINNGADWLTGNDSNTAKLWQEDGANNEQNPCPAGYRIPSKDEWIALLGFPNDNKADGKVKTKKPSGSFEEITASYVNTSNTTVQLPNIVLRKINDPTAWVFESTINGTKYSFPSYGRRYESGQFVYPALGWYWTSTISGTQQAFGMYWNMNGDSGAATMKRGCAASVRCVKVETL